MLLKEFSESIDYKYNEIHNKEKPWESLHNERSYFESVIDTFFSKDGEQGNIRKIYDSLENNIKLENVTIDQEDFVNANKVYNEYFEGMYKFVSNICETTEITESIMDDFMEKTNNAMKQDHLFIECLEDHPEFNPKKTISCKEAVSVLNDMINFKSEMELKEENCNAFINDSNVDNTVKANSLKLLCESVSYYWLESIKNMIHSYDVMKESMENGNTESGSFVLF